MKSKALFTLVNVLYAMSQWAIVLIIARISLSDAGSYSYILALVMPILMFSTLGLRNLLATEEDDSLYLSYFLIRVVTLTISLIICIAVYHIFAKDKIDFLLFIYVFIYKSIDLIFDIFYGRYQQLEKIGRITYSKLIRTVLVSLVLLFSIFMNSTVEYIFKYLMLLTLVQVIAELIILFWSGVDFSKVKLSKAIIINGSKLSLVLLIVMLITTAPRYYIENKFGLIFLGVFAFINQLIQAGNIVIQSVSFLYVKKISTLYKLEKRDAFLLFEKIALVVLLITLIPGVLVAIYFTNIADLLINKNIELSNLEKVSILFFAFSIYSQSIIGHFLTAIRKINIQPMLFSCSLVFLLLMFVLFELELWQIFICVGGAYSIILVYYVYLRMSIYNENTIS